MKRKTREVQITRQDDGAIVFDKSSGTYFQVNAVGLSVIEGLAAGKTEEKITTDIEEIFCLNHVQAKNDVDIFIEKLREEGLV